MTHRFSKEILYHFQCGHCDKWWTIGDFHKTLSFKRGIVNCPHCGEAASIEEKEE